jgi:hypothetical protein
MSKARDLANAGTALTTVSATELGYLDGVTSAVQTQINSKEATLPDQTGNTGKYLTTNGTAKSWGTVSQYALPSQTGNSGKFLTTNGTAESWGTVNQPLTFTSRLNPASEYRFNEIAYNGSNLYVAVGNNGKLYSSPDGITWTSRTSGFSTSNIYTVAFGNGLFVAGGVSGILTTSTDGITWTARTSNMGSNAIQQVIYANSIWVGVGSGGGTTNTGGIIYSTDGITWTRKSQSLTVGTTYYSVGWNGTNWIVGTSLSTNNYLYASTPSGTWTAGLAGGGSIFWVGCDGANTFIFNSSNSVFCSSTSTTLASITQVSGTFAYANQTQDRIIAAIYNGKIYFSNGYYLRDFTTTTGTQFPLVSEPTLVPDVTFASGTAPNLSSSGGCIWAGPTGIIIGGNQGRIWTSF